MLVRLRFFILILTAVISFAFLNAANAGFRVYISTPGFYYDDYPDYYYYPGYGYVYFGGGGYYRHHWHGGWHHHGGWNHHGNWHHH